MAEPTDGQIEAGAIALYAMNNANGDTGFVESRWAHYADSMKAPYRRWSRTVLAAALTIPVETGHDPR